MAEIAKKLNNGVASLISAPPKQFDFGGSLNDNGFQYKLNVQPVIPSTLAENWNLITRTIVPDIYQTDRIGNATQSGLGDQRISSTFLQPFLSYTTKTHTTFGLNTESIYDWVNKQWTVL
jgi:hypothetical protein